MIKKIYYQKQAFDFNCGGISKVNFQKVYNLGNNIHAKVWLPHIYSANFQLIIDTTSTIYSMTARRKKDYRDCLM